MIVQQAFKTAFKGTCLDRLNSHACYAFVRYLVVCYINFYGTCIDTFKRLLKSEDLNCNEDLIKPVLVLPFRFFDSIDICKYRSDWMESRLHGVLPSNCEGQSLFVTHVEVFETAEVELCLFQGGARYAIHLGIIALSAGQ